MDDAYFEEFDQQDLERIEEDNEAPVGPDEAEEAAATARIVKPKRIVTKPQIKLDDKRLKGPRGLCVLESIFKEAVLRGPGYERRDLDTIMSLLEHWAHRMFPKMTFDDCLDKIEELGHKKSISSYVTLMRMGCADPPGEKPEDVALIRSRSPSPQRAVDPFDQLLDRPPQSQLTEEQRERMERNKLVALERRRARLKAMYEKTNCSTEEPENLNNAVELASAEVQNDETLNTFDKGESHISNQSSNNSVSLLDKDENGSMDLTEEPSTVNHTVINKDMVLDEPSALVITDNSMADDNGLGHEVTNSEN